MMTSEIQKIICRHEVLKFNLCCENVKYLFSDWECDVLSLNKVGYLTEFEVKISKSDFKADSKKRKVKFYEMRIQKHIPNYFYYVCPDGLIKNEQLPNYAGLFYVIDNELKVIKKAPLLSKFKHDKEKVLIKFCRILSERNYLGSCRLTFENKNRDA